MSTPTATRAAKSKTRRSAYSVRQIAGILGVSALAVRRLIYSGALEATLAGKQYVVSAETLDSFLAGSDQGGAA